MTHPLPPNQHGFGSVDDSRREEVDGHGGCDAFIGVGLSGSRPDVPEETDACLQRLLPAISARPGVTRIHSVLVDARPALCLHYDPVRLPTARATRLARLACIAVTSQRWLAHFAWQTFACEEATPYLAPTARHPAGGRAASPPSRPGR